MYICMTYEKNNSENRATSSPIFWPTYCMAKRHANKTATIIHDFWSPYTPDIPLRNRVFFVKIFEIPFGENIAVNDWDTEDLENLELYQYHVEDVYDSQTTAVFIIQKWWRKIYNKRLLAATIIKKRLCKAIANPYTELCRRRLLREFSEMGNIN
jgi:hypothetical protein